MSDQAALMLTTTCMGLAAQLWSGGLPERSTVSSWPADDTHVGHVRTACVSNGAASLAVGVAASALTRSWWPLIGVSLTVAYLSGSYLCAAHTSSNPDIPGAAASVDVRWIR